MELARVLPFKYYDKTLKRYDEDAFKNQGKGISVVELACAETATPGGVCEHLKRYYPQFVDNDALVYWVIDSTELEEFAKETRLSFVQKTSRKGDECHYDIKGMSDEKAYDYLNNHFNPVSVRLCLQGNNYPLTTEQIENLLEHIDQLRKDNPAS